MKPLVVHFDNVAWGSRSGPNTFLQRLARELSVAGHAVTLDGTQANVSLVSIEPTGAPLAKRVVQRLDGFWSKPDDFKHRNVSIRRLYEGADAVVWQSLFDRMMALKHFGIPGHGTGEVICNGAELSPVKQLTIPRLAEMRAQYERIYVCSSNWHPQKRLRANVQLFERLRQQHPNSCLIVLGDHPDFRATGPHVFYGGSLDHAACAEVYSAADWMLHLAWADHCPNVVIEALAQGTPVACSEVGGTRELVGGYGRVLVEEPYGYELADYDNPPPINVSQVIDLPPRVTLDYGSIADIDITHVAAKYVELFERVLAK